MDVYLQTCSNTVFLCQWILWSFFHIAVGFDYTLRFFPRASERRVLVIVGVCQTFSHNIFKSSRLLIFTSSHLHIFSSSHLLIFTSVHLHIFTSSHLHICSSSHLHICSSSHLHIFTSSHLLIFTSSHLHIFSSSHLLIFTSLHPHIFTFSLALLLSCPHALLPSCSLLLFYFSLEGAKQCQRDGTKRNPFARNEVRSTTTAVKLRFLLSGRSPFARNEVRSPKTAWGKIAICGFPSQPFRTKWSSIAKNCMR